jgi:hypothetical protein
MARGAVEAARTARGCRPRAARSSRLVCTVTSLAGLGEALPTVRTLWPTSRPDVPERAHQLLDRGTRGLGRPAAAAAGRRPSAGRARRGRSPRPRPGRRRGIRQLRQTRAARGRRWPIAQQRRAGSCLREAFAQARRVRRGRCRSPRSSARVGGGERRRRSGAGMQREWRRLPSPGSGGGSVSRPSREAAGAGSRPTR